MENTLVVLVAGLVLVVQWLMVRDVRKIKGDLGYHGYIDRGQEHNCGDGHDFGWGDCDPCGGCDGGFL